MSANLVDMYSEYEYAAVFVGINVCIKTNKYNQKCKQHK